MSTTIALLHPGEMGAAVGACLVAQGHRVLWIPTGRSPASHKRAEAAGLQPANNLQQALAAAHVVMSICPPQAAVTLAEHVAGHNFRGIYLDANAISPDTMRRIVEIFKSTSAQVVDGAIIGPPPRQEETARLYLSGAAAPDLSVLFGQKPLEARVIIGAAGASSALKMCYAAYTKGLTALLTDIRALANHEDVEAELLAEWQLSQPAAVARSEVIENQARKAWRWMGEMHEIADTFQNAGLPDGFHRAAAELYERLAIFKDEAAPVALAEVIRAVQTPTSNPDVTPPSAAEA